MENQSKRLPKIAIIGAGKVGITVGKLLQSIGCEITAIAGRDQKRLEQAAILLGNPQICAAQSAPKDAELILLSVSDDAIEPLCTDLADRAAFTSRQTLVHLSGALSSEALKTAREKCGTAIASIHPLQTFSSVESGMASLPGSYWFCEGEESALATVLPLIEQMGGKTRTIPTEKKALYHAASVIACNYLVALMDVAITTAEAASLDRDLAWQALEPLIQATLLNINKFGTTEALTGPIARGDVNTISKHLEALKEQSPDLARIYAALGLWTTEIAERKGLSKEHQEQLKEILKFTADS